MVKRGRRSRGSSTGDSINSVKANQSKVGRTARLAEERGEGLRRDYGPTPAQREDSRVEQLLGPQQEIMLPAPLEQQSALAVTDLQPWYESIAEMRERIREAEENMQRSRQAQQVLETEMVAARQKAEQAEEELAEAAKKAAYLKHEAQQVCAEGQTLREQLDEEERHWQQRLENEQLMLAEVEQKLRVAEEESQRVNHAKEVAARMNEKEMWRLGSSKQGLWLQRRQVQGNALPMSRGKDGSWQAARVAPNSGSTYAQNLRGREQKHKQIQREDEDNQGQQRLNRLSESAQALAERQSSQLEEDFLAQLAQREAARHLEALTSQQQDQAEPQQEEQLEQLTDQEECLLEQPLEQPEQIIEQAEQFMEEEEAAEQREEREEQAPPLEQREQNEEQEQTLAQAEQYQPAVEQLLGALLEQGVDEPPSTVAPPTPSGGGIVNEDVLTAMHQREQPAPPPIMEQNGPQLNDEVIQALRQLEMDRVPLPRPVINIEDLPSLRPGFNAEVEEEAIAAAESLPEEEDPLQFLALRAARFTAANQAAPANPTNILPDISPPPLYPPPPPETPLVIPINDEDMERLSRQANILAQQHLTQQHKPPDDSTGVREVITQKVAEDTGRYDYLLKEQHTAEMAIAAAMSAARKAAQSAMAISEQVNMQMPEFNRRGFGEEERPYSVERIIADALSKASAANQDQR